MNRIKDLRRSKHITQEKLASILGVTQSNLSGWETEKWQPDHATLLKLADYFEVSIDYLLGRTDEAENIKAPANNGEGLDKYIQVLEKAGITEEKLSRLTVEDINLIIAYAKGIIDSKRNSK